jgi:hypothetical protein
MGEGNKREDPESFWIQNYYYCWKRERSRIMSVYLRSWLGCSLRKETLKRD